MGYTRIVAPVGVGDSKKSETEKWATAGNQSGAAGRVVCQRSKFNVQRSTLIPSVKDEDKFSMISRSRIGKVHIRAP